MSFNIRYGTAADGEHQWGHRKNAVVKRIRAFSPDLLGLQECREDNQAEFIRASLPDYEFFGVPRGGRGEQWFEMNPVLFKKERYSLIKNGVFWISPTPTLQASKLRDSHFPRTVTWARLQTKTDPSRQLVFANTHLDYAPGLPYQSARILMEQLPRINRGRPIILTGDFNTERGSEPHQVLTDHGHGEAPYLRDSFLPTASDAKGGTFHDYGRMSNPPALDWILASPQFTALEWGVDQTQVEGLYPSDHFPVTAVLSLDSP